MRARHVGLRLPVANALPYKELFVAARLHCWIVSEVLKKQFGSEGPPEG